MMISDPDIARDRFDEYFGQIKDVVEKRVGEHFEASLPVGVDEEVFKEIIAYAICLATRGNNV